MVFGDARVYLCVFFICVFGLSRWFGKNRLELPPGPSALPILGSVHHLTLEFQEKTFFRWRKTYGDVIYFKLFRTPTILLNSLESARDLLDKRSGNYSDRPRMVLLAELVGHDLSLVPMRYGDRFRKRRKWLHESISKMSALTTYRPIQQREVHVLLRNLLVNPDAFFEHLYRYVVATLLEITYGQALISMEDEIVQLAERTVTATNEGGNPGSMLVDFFPVLKYLPTWMPGAGFKRTAFKGRVCLDAWRMRGVNMVREAMSSGKAAPCITASLLNAFKGSPNEEELEDIRRVGIDIYGAGTETTHGTLVSFILAMVRNPDILRQAQEEMDRVVGHDRLPNFSDRESLPYINALVEELYRWNPGLPLAVPHRVISDDRYRDFDIPAGCMVMPNIWGMTRDPKYFPDPEEFRPERHLGTEKVEKGKVLPSCFVFGFGRRVCPGQAFADASIWLAVANMISVFDIRKPVDAAGTEYTPPAAFKPGFTSRPQPFCCQIVPRSANTAAAITNSV